MIKRTIIVPLIVLAVICFIIFLYRKREPNEVDFAVLKCPIGINLTGDSAKYVGWGQYEIYVRIANRTSKDLVYTPVFAIIKDKNGRKLGLAMANTGRIVKVGDTMPLIMDTIIPRDTGKPAAIELYSE